MKELIILTRKTHMEIIIVIFSVIVFIYIMYAYANTWIHYVIGVLGTFAFISTCIKEGISQKGFISIYKYEIKILF